MGRNCCITIERQYGSGGREVARILSERLGIPCYGRELLAVTAADNGISIEELKKLDEKRTGSLLHDLVLYAFRFQNYNKMQEPFDINKEVSDTIRRLARKGPCILSEDALISPWMENAMYLNCLSTLHPWRSANAAYARWMT